MSKVKLGDEVKDKVSGFQGIVIAKTKWLSGCNTALVEPPMKSDGTKPDNHTFDIPRLEVVKSAKVVIPEATTDPGGPKPSVERKYTKQI